LTEVPVQRVRRLRPEKITFSVEEESHSPSDSEEFETYKQISPRVSCFSKHIRKCKRENKFRSHPNSYQVDKTDKCDSNTGIPCVDLPRTGQLLFTQSGSTSSRPRIIRDPIKHYSSQF